MRVLGAEMSHWRGRRWCGTIQLLSGARFSHPTRTQTGQESLSSTSAATIGLEGHQQGGVQGSNG